MKRIFRKLKIAGGAFLSGMISLVLTGKVDAIMPEYGPPLVLAPMYGPFPIGSLSLGEILLRFFPFVIGVTLVFLIAPILGLLWYRKRKGTKKWPKIIAWVFIAIFFLISIWFLLLFYRCF